MASGSSTVGRKSVRITMEAARSGLAKLWFIGSGLLFLIIVVQSILGKYGDEVQKVWSWFIPIVSPTLGLMVGVLGAATMKKDDSRKTKKSFYELSWWLSVTYLVVVGMTIILEPFSPLEPVQLLSVSNYWLAPIQAIVVAAISFLFSIDTVES